MPHPDVDPKYRQALRDDPMYQSVPMKKAGAGYTTRALPEVPNQNDRAPGRSGAGKPWKPRGRK